MAARRTRLQRTTLASLRSLVRHARRVDNLEGAGPWVSHIMDEFRAGAAEPDKTKAKHLRATAADVAACFDAVREQQRLLEAYAGVEVDSSEYRKAAARRVGLTIPERVPLSVSDVASKYDLSSRLGVAGGVKGLKAQLYNTGRGGGGGGGAAGAAAGGKAPSGVSPASSSAATGVGGMNDPDSWGQSR